MGAEQFDHIGRGKTVQEAFDNAVKEAQYDYGHAGYTGTIAEKDSFVEVPFSDDFTHIEVYQALSNSIHGPTDALVEILGDKAEFFFNAYDDKWGPCVAIRTPEKNEWLFCGWASC